MKLFKINLTIALIVCTLMSSTATDKPDAAIDWLLNATEIYPNDANLFVTLGDLYEKSGKQYLAVEAYKKALTIDPNFEKAKAKLKQQP